jgi:hypothetical protein
MIRPLALALALAAAACLLVPSGVAAQAPGGVTPAPAPEVPESVQREVKAAQDMLARAITEFEGPQQSRSIVTLDDVISRLEAVGPAALPASGKETLAQAYEYRGRAYFGIGLSEKASENFRQLVQLKPEYALSKERVSPKVVDLFNGVKRALVGYLAVSSQPAGAEVTLRPASGTSISLGLTDFFPVEVLAGSIRWRWSGRATRRKPARSASPPRTPRPSTSPSCGWRRVSSSSPSRPGSRSGSTAS